jgi:hypothetical protein
MVAQPSRGPKGVIPSISTTPTMIAVAVELPVVRAVPPAAQPETANDPVVEAALENAAEHKNW